MSPSINYVDGADVEEVRIRHLEQVDWVEWARAQVLKQTVQIESHFTNREFLHQREITEVDFEGADDREECVQRLMIAFEMVFSENFVQKELVDERGVISELVDRARESSTAGDMGD